MPRLSANAAPSRLLAFGTSVSGLPAVKTRDGGACCCEVDGFSAISACQFLSAWPAGDDEDSEITLLLDTLANEIVDSLDDVSDVWSASSSSSRRKNFRDLGSALHNSLHEKLVCAMSGVFCSLVGGGGGGYDVACPSSSLLVSDRFGHHCAEVLSGFCCCKVVFLAVDDVVVGVDVAPVVVDEVVSVFGTGLGGVLDGAADEALVVVAAGVEA